MSYMAISRLCCGRARVTPRAARAVRGQASGRNASGQCTAGAPPGALHVHSGPSEDCMPAAAAKPARPKSVTELLGLPDPPKTGRERLLAAAIELFYRHGFGAVGIDQVIAAAGVTKTTFYKHFEGKDDLMVAAVQRRDEWESAAWNRAVRKLAGDDPIKQLLAMWDVMDLWFNDPEYRGCIFMNAAAEFPNPHDPVHQAASSYKRRVRDHFRDLAKSAG